jgi:hypothetical protein
MAVLRDDELDAVSGGVGKRFTAKAKIIDGRFRIRPLVCPQRPIEGLGEAEEPQTRRFRARERRVQIIEHSYFSTVELLCDSNTT